MILLIETSSDVCSVALADEEKIISIRESSNEKNHSALITVFIDEVLRESNVAIKNIAAVAVNAGPGSYTGLRIGLSTAKGLCYALNKPLIMIDSLLSLQFGIRRLVALNASEFLSCTIDNRRDEFFYSLFDLDGKQIVPTTLSSTTDEIFLNNISNKKILFVGSAILKLKNIFGDEYHYQEIKNSAAHLQQEAFKKFSTKDFSDIAYAEPFYMKEVYVGKEKNK